MVIIKPHLEFFLHESTNTCYIQYKQHQMLEIKEFNRIQYFQVTFKPSIKTEIENKVDEYENCDELVRKTVTTEATKALWLTLYIWEMDQHYPQSNRAHFSINNSNNQESIMKDLCTKDPKAKNFGSSLGLSLTLQYINVEPSNKKKQK